MPLFDLPSLAGALPAAWQSHVLGQVGPARLKVLRMDEMTYGEETHDYNEALLVLSGQMLLEVQGAPVTVAAGAMYLVEAGTGHAVLAGSHGTLMIVDV
ncbi:cupin domain-containing protein [Massilia atriviolacea]|uniref:Cupin domain-containing protein n=1 Tax=Massilia atriviolacea TaxID=2495579 RepID=A0A430HGF3_9BURK|nr:cupin domain-containing protein [Massilia atriviolacea]RSZ56608.1 cupin domain-containing protein [Massilia atriviolacea]